MANTSVIIDIWWYLINNFLCHTVDKTNDILIYAGFYIKQLFYAKNIQIEIVVNIIPFACVFLCLFSLDDAVIKLLIITYQG